MKKSTLLLSAMLGLVSGFSMGIFENKPWENDLSPVNHPIGDLGISRIAVEIVEVNGHPLKYFYSNLGYNGQTRWYLHHVDAF